MDASSPDARHPTAFRLDGQVALITGAAGQLGRVFSRTLGDAGATVLVSDLDKAACDGACRELAVHGIRAVSLPMDVSSPPSVQAAFAEVASRHKSLDVLVNNAGIAVFTPFETRSFEEFMRVMSVNAGGTFLCTQAAQGIMRRQESGGRIVNIGSIYGVVSGDPRIYSDTPRNTSEAYAASKAAVIQMTRYFAIHLAPHRIRVNAVSPGGILAGQGQSFVANYASRTPMARMGNDHELGGAVLFLSTEASSYVTGQNLLVDGGWTAW